MFKTLFVTACVAVLSLTTSAQLEPQYLEQLVNTDIPQAQNRPNVAAQANGDYIISWWEGSWSNGTLFVRKYNADHSAAGDPLEIASNVDEAYIRSMDNGVYAVAYIKTNEDLKFKTINIDNVISAEITVAGSTEDFDFDTHDNEIAFLYSNTDSNREMHMRVYSLATNDWASGDILVSEDQSNSYDYPTINFHSDGSLVLTYMHRNNYSGCCDINNQIERKTYNSNFIAEIPSEIIYSADSDQLVLYGTDVSVNANDEMLLVVTHGSTASIRRSRVWIADRDGALIVNNDLIISTGGSNLSIYDEPETTFYNNGDFAVVHGFEFGGFQNPNDSEAYVYYANDYHANNSGWQQMNATDAGSQYYVSIAPLPDNSFVSVWQGNGFQGDTNGIYARAYNAYAFPGARLSWTGEAQVSENGSSLVVEVVLATQPADEVIVDLTSSNPNEGALSTEQLEFSPENWNVPQEVIVSGVDDMVDDGHTAWDIMVATGSSIDLQYAGLAEFDVAFVTLDDEASISAPLSQSICANEDFSANIIATNNGGNINAISATSSDQTVVANGDIEIEFVAGDTWQLAISEDNLSTAGITTITIVSSDGSFDYTSTFDLTIGGATISAGTDQTVCAGSSVTLLASNPDGAIINWNDGIEDGASLMLDEGTYIFTVSGTFEGCTTEDQVTITVSPTPIETIGAGEDLTVCEGTTVGLNAINPNNLEYVWSDNVVNGEGFVAPLGENIYTIQAEVNGCSISDEVTVMVYEATPNAIIAGEDQTVCAGEQVVLTAEALEGATTNWSDNVQDGVAFSQAEGTQTYTLFGEYEGCQYEEEVMVTVLPAPQSDLSAGADQQVCFGEMITLEAENTENIDFSWAGNIVDGEAFSQDAGTETYTVSTLVNGCEYTDEVEVEVLPELDQPTVTFFGGELIASVADGYQWYINGNIIPTLTEQIVAPIDEGNYSVVVTMDGCTSAASEDYNYIPQNIPTLELTFDVFPNPATDRVQISAAGNIDSILLVDIMGKTVIAQSPRAGSTIDLDLSDLAVGTYILSVVSGGKISAQRIVKN